MTIALSDIEFGARAARHLTDDVVAWLTLVDPSGTPQPAPVWFLWDGSSILVYSHGEAKRLAHLRANSRVALHGDGDGTGGDIVVLTRGRGDRSGRAARAGEPRVPGQVRGPDRGGLADGGELRVDLLGAGAHPPEATARALSSAQLEF
jgi:PPOX class probable F420-dependent enzyme